MRPKLKENEKRVKISITLNQEINKKLENDIVNKPKLIELLLKKHYGDKKML